MLISPNGSEPSLQPGAKVGELKQRVASRERLEALHEVCSSRDCWLQPDQRDSFLQNQESWRLTTHSESTDHCLVAILVLTESVELRELPV
jgi:hypothetical protein